MNFKIISMAVISFAIIAVVYYGVSPLFHIVKVDELIPSDKSEDKTMKENEPEGARGYAIQGTTAHPASGQVKIVETDGKKYIRYENLKTINGPDIYVYLSKDLEAKEYVNIGAVRATEGNVNYEIPEGVNPADYRYVMIWCKQFGVLFNSAEINK